MSDKVLVDTSAWIVSFKESDNQKLKNYLREALNSDRVVTTNIIILELLQGCKDKKEYETLKSRLEVLPLYGLTGNTWSIAYEMGFLLRRKGITIPTVDIMIASIAKENTLSVFHYDNHLKVICREIGVKAIDFL
ncbi:MAG: PIN domain-containing protein [Nitrospirae bacterium]|nr:PIN domain-containing protein [Nitrospirota bacterium]